MYNFFVVFLVCSFYASTEGTTHPVRIVGGETIDISEVPYSVVLFLRYSASEPYKYWCGGSLISTTVVVAVGHCIKPGAQYAIRAGSSNRTVGGQWIEVQKHIKHENYQDNDSIDFDIALHILKTPVELNSNVGLVSLPRQGQDVPDGTIMMHAGWGNTEYVPKPIDTEVLRFIWMPKVNQEVCKHTFPYVGRNQICAGNMKDVAGCHGDSGSGLVWNDILIGLDSYGNGICNTKEPTVFTRVSSFVDWIEKHIKQENLLI